MRFLEGVREKLELCCLGGAGAAVLCGEGAGLDGADPGLARPLEGLSLAGKLANPPELLELEVLVAVAAS